jgi:hypothetical protein
MMSAVGCKSKTSITKVMQEEEITVPFSGFKTDKNYFRAVASGFSPDMNVAKKVALQNARSEIASSIQSLFNQVTTDYINQYVQDATPDLSQKFQEMSQNIVSQVLTNLTISDQKFFKSKADNNIRCFVAVEMSKQDVGKAVTSRISQEAKDRIDFDEYQYRKIFDKALKEYQGK